MARIELFPSLGHCIETTASLEFNRLIEDYMDQSGEVPELEVKIELMRDFLVSADFPALRQQSEFYLLMGEKVRFTVSDENDVLSCRMDIVPD